MVGLAWALTLVAALPRGERVEAAEKEVRLALRAEAAGDVEGRREHLKRAVALAPDDPRARGLLGQMAVGKGWERADEVAAKERDDERQAAALAEYNALRARTPETAEAQWRLALWCEGHGLAAEAEAHFVAVTRLDPTRDAAWIKLGCVRDGDRWVRPERLEAERLEAEAQARADRDWGPRLAALKRGLADPSQHDQAARALGEVREPRAVPAIWRVFAEGSPSAQLWAAWMLGHIDAPASSQALAILAVASPKDEARDRAVGTLKDRDPAPFVGLLIQQLRAPLAYQMRPVRGPGATGSLTVEGETAIVERYYEAALAPTNRPLPFGPAGVANPFVGGRVSASSAAGLLIDAGRRREVPSRVPSMLTESHRQAMATERHIERDAYDIEKENAAIAASNRRVRRVLFAVTGIDHGSDREAWAAWWTEQRGYAYERPKPVEKPVIVQDVATVVAAPTFVAPSQFSAIHTACFAAGTPVRTRDGLRAIESLKVGDVVLAQDVETGSLAFEPIVTVIHNTPHATLRVVLDNDGRDEPIVVTPIHRFWRAGRGWAMARELKAGDKIRTNHGVTTVRRVEAAGVRPVFNLEVARAATYFVGWTGALVHDNGLVAPTRRPFDGTEP